MCEYCNEYCERKFLSERELSQIDYKTCTGLQMEVNPMDKELNVYCVLENKNIPTNMFLDYNELFKSIQYEDNA